MSLRSASMLSGVRDIPSDLATVARRSSGILLSPHHVTWARYISQRASRLFDAVRRPAVADRYVLRHPLPMNIPPVSARLRDPKLKQSPIREIMKLADRQNVIALGLDPVERFEHDTHLVVAEGDHVITEHTETWHFETGEKIVNHFVTVHELRDGKIKLWRDYWDLGSMLAQAPKWWIERLAKFSETDFS